MLLVSCLSVWVFCRLSIIVCQQLKNNKISLWLCMYVYIYTCTWCADNVSCFKAPNTDIKHWNHNMTHSLNSLTKHIQASPVSVSSERAHHHQRRRWGGCGRKAACRCGRRGPGGGRWATGCHLCLASLSLSGAARCSRLRPVKADVVNVRFV